MGTVELLIILAFPIMLAVPMLAVRYLGSSLVRGSGADRTIVVPVADVLRGTLPMVCAKTGAKAHGLAEERSEQLSAVWFLLLLLGPVGIIAYAILWAVKGSQGTQADIPLSNDALEEIRGAARTSLLLAAAAGGTVVAFAITLAASAPGFVQVVAGVLAIGSLCGWMYATTRARMSRVRVRLDNSKKLVHLDGVHPGFVTAVQKDARAKGLM